MKLHCDVLVIGSGPAGSALAQHLGLRGHEVILVDKKAFPRAKPCGEFASPQCLPLLRELGVDDALRAAGARRVHGMRMQGHGKHAIGHFLPMGGTASTCGYGITREVLDTRLLEQARRVPAVSVRERSEFRSLLRDADGRTAGAVIRDASGTDHRLSARFVIGADGVHSRVARELGVQRPLAWLDRFALVTRYRGVLPQETAEVHMFAGGYFAATAVDGDRFHVNLLLDRKALRHRHGDWDEFVHAHLQRVPAFAQRLRGAVRDEPWRGIGPLAFSTSAQALPGAALVGDACGYVDPLTGEGIYFALFTARCLARALDAALVDPKREAGALRRYQAERRREVAPRMFLAKLLQRGMRQDWVARAVLGALARFPQIADLLVTLTGDAAHPRDLVRPSFWRTLRRTEAST